MIGYQERNNLQAPWRGLATQIADARLPAGLVSIAENVDLFFGGILRPRRGYDAMDFRLDGVADFPTEGIWPWRQFSGPAALVMYHRQNLYIEVDPGLRTGLLPSVSPKVASSEGLDFLKSHQDVLGVFDDQVDIPPDAATFNRTIFIVNGWDQNQANSGAAFRRMGIQPPPNDNDLIPSSNTSRWVPELPEDYRFGVTVSIVGGATVNGPGPLSVWRVWAAYFDNNTGRYSDPCNPAFPISLWPTLIGGGSPATGVIYTTTGSNDPSVTEIHWFRSTRNGTVGYKVAEAANVAGVPVNSSVDSFTEEKIPSNIRLSFKNRHPRIARYILNHKGRIFLAGGLRIDLDGITVAVTNGDEEITFSSAVLNDSMVGIQFRFDGVDRIYTLAEVRSSTEGVLLTEFEGVDNATATVIAEGFEETLSWSEPNLPESHPLLNQLVVRGDSVREGLHGSITGLAEFGDAVLILFRRSVWMLRYSTDPQPGRGARLERLPGAAGCIAHRTVVRVGARTFWLGEDAWWEISGGRPMPRSDGILADLLQSAHLPSLPRSWAVHDRTGRRILIGIRVADPTDPARVNDWPDTILAWYYETDDWTTHGPFPWVLGSAGVYEDAATLEERVIIAADGFHQFTYGRGLTDGANGAQLHGLESAADSVGGGGLVINLPVGAVLPIAPGLGFASYVVFKTGALAPNGKIPILSNTANSFTIGIVGAAGGDLYKIGGVDMAYRVLFPHPAISKGRQNWFLTVLFQVIELGQFQLESILELRLFRNGLLHDEWKTNNRFVEEGWRVLADGSTIEVDMSFQRRPATKETRSVVQIPCAMVPYHPTDVFHVELRGPRTGREIEVVAISSDEKVLAE